MFKDNLITGEEICSLSFDIKKLLTKVFPLYSLSICFFLSFFLSSINGYHKIIIMIFLSIHLFIYVFSNYLYLIKFSYLFSSVAIMVFYLQIILNYL